LEYSIQIPTHLAIQDSAEETSNLLLPDIASLSIHKNITESAEVVQEMRGQSDSDIGGVFDDKDIASVTSDEIEELCAKEVNQKGEHISMISQGTKDLYIVKAGYDEHISVNNDEIEDPFTRKVDLSEYSSMTSYCYRIDKMYIGKLDESEPTSEISNVIDHQSTSQNEYTSLASDEIDDQSIREVDQCENDNDQPENIDQSQHIRAAADQLKTVWNMHCTCGI